MRARWHWLKQTLVFPSRRGNRKMVSLVHEISIKLLYSLLAYPVSGGIIEDHLTYVRSSSLPRLMDLIVTFRSPLYQHPMLLLEKRRVKTAGM